MLLRIAALIFLIDYVTAGSIDVGASELGRGKRVVEDNIPVIEIRGEGKPMTSAQIRHLEEMSNGAPLDIKTEQTFKPAKCPAESRRKDFITFHYKVFTEDNKKVYQTYGDNPVRIQLGVGMVMPGLDKGLKGMCNDELRKIKVPYRLSRKAKSRVWKNIPNDEHWLTFNIEMMSVEPYSNPLQFAFLDTNNDTVIDEDDLVKWLDSMKRDFGKKWNNDDIDNVAAAKYYIKYFDINGDGKVDFSEFERVMSRDEELMKKGSKEKGRQRDPGVAWILDFNNDGLVSFKESDDAADIIEHDPQLLPIFKDEL